MSCDKIEEAEVELKETRETVLSKFCPLLKDKCREDCASYYEGTIRTSYDKKLFVHPAVCYNSLVCGSIVLEQDGQYTCHV